MLRSTTAQVESCPWSVTFSCTIFILSRSKLTYVTRFWQYLRKSKLKQDFNARIKLKSVSNWCHQASHNLVQMASYVTSSTMLWSMPAALLIHDGYCSLIVNFLLSKSGWSLLCPGMWRRVTVWLVPDVSIRRSGLIVMSQNVQWHWSPITGDMVHFPEEQRP
jgi:hypothetical protein